MADTPSEPPTPALQMNLFGPFEARVHGEPLPRLRSRKGHRLLALLALRHGRELEREWLMDVLWPDNPPQLAAHSLRNSLADLRKALASEAGRISSPTPRTLMLDLTGACVDLLVFDRAIASDSPEALEEAVALARAPLLEAWAEDWAFQERQVRESAVLAALGTLTSRALEANDLAAAERYLRLTIARDPLREQCHRALMQLLLEAGSAAAARSVYHELRRRLHREANAEPDPATRALFDRIGAGARRGGSARRQGSRGGRRVALRPADSNAAGATELPLFVLLRTLAGAPLVGRQTELGTIQRYIEAAAQGEGGTLLLSGEPGIGKTRLAVEAGEWARQRGFQVLIGRCDEAGPAPYQPFGEALREYLACASPEQAAAALPPPVACELVRLVPWLTQKVKDVPRVGPAAGDRGQALVDAIGEYFALLTARQAPILLVLDDLHWADEGSLATLSALARRAKRLRLLIVGTYRNQPPDLQPPLEQALAALNRERAAGGLALRRLPAARVGEMVAALFPDATAPAAFIAALYRQTEGNPFFIEEVLKHLVEGEAIYRSEGCWHIEPLAELGVPESVRMTIGRRLERLPAVSREALTLAAVIGQEFRFEVLLHASEREADRLLAMLDEWLGARLVVEEWRGREEAYRFQHALIREVLYAGVNRHSQARLHEQVGLALEAVCAGPTPEPVEELAFHFARARSPMAMEKGIEYCLRAGKEARFLYANEMAIRHLTAALELLDGLPADEPHLRQRWEVVFHLAKACSECRAFGRAQAVLQEYLAVAERTGYPWGMAAAHRWMASSSMQSPDDLNAENSRRDREEHLQKCLEIAEQHNLSEWRARARVGLAQLHFLDLPRVESLLRETLPAAAGLSRVDVQEIYGGLVRAYAVHGKWDAFAAVLRESVPVGEPIALGFALGLMEDRLVRAGKRAEFVAFSEEVKGLYAQAGVSPPLRQWYLQPAIPSQELDRPLFQDHFAGPKLHGAWQWHDPSQVSAYSLSERPGHLTLRAGPGVDLNPYFNLNAPRMLLEVHGDFALETKMEGDWDQREEMGQGGLLVWKDALHYVRLEKFSRDVGHQGSVQLEARIRGDYQAIGRGQLLGSSYRLRVERVEEQFTALCSTDGVHWLTCGQVALPVKDPLWVGVTASYGMVVHFDAVQVLGRGQGAEIPGWSPGISGPAQDR